MRLEDLTIALRPRQPWEAADLGCALVRRDYGQVLLLWLISAVPLWILLALLLRDHPHVFALTAWWLKPLYDRLPLYYLSRAAFGSKPSFKETLREWPRLWSRFLLSALLIRRLSSIRSFALPIWMLEGQRGKAVKRRLRALAVDGGSSGTSVTWVFVKLELAVWLGIMALVSSLGPASGLPDWSELFLDSESYLDMPNAELWSSYVLYLCAMTVVEPFYVGAGFGLYLNSRTKIEGWDIELVFRRMAARLRPIAMAALAFFFILPGALTAQESPSKPQTRQAVTDALKEILAKPEFKEHSRTQRVWIPDQTEEVKNSQATMSNGPVLGRVFYGLAIAVVAVLLILAARWLILNKHLFLSGRFKSKHRPEAGPKVIMGLDITRESLPTDIVKAARAAWVEEQPKEALSLLYRGMLSRLVELRRLPIRDSDTEDDCLLKVAQMGDTAVTEFFRHLTLAWVRMAYAGVTPGTMEFEDLCRTWPFLPSATAVRQHVIKKAALVLLLLPHLIGCEGHWEEINLPQGYEGKARTNPFLAAQQLLEIYGHQVERLPTLNELPEPEHGVIIVSGESGMPEARARQLLAWANEGGHLIYAVAGCAPYNDWGMFSGLSSYVYTGNEERADPILETLGVQLESAGNLKALIETFQKMSNLEDPSPPDSQTSKDLPPSDKADEIAPRLKIPNPEPPDVPTLRSSMKVGKDTFEVDFVDVLKLSLNRPLANQEQVSGRVDQAPALSLVHGLGRVTILNHARPLRNRFLDENDHARWLLALVGEESCVVKFIVTLQSSFWALLWDRAWMPLVGLALLTMTWLWLHMPRFGPLRQVALHDTKHFAEHISALGQFFYRLKRPDVLFKAAADAVRVRALRRYPHLVNLDDEALIQLLSETSTLPKDRIREAFKNTEKVAGHEVVRRLQDLQTLKSALS
ncbi:DUF4350 domain-containing protein [Prosthecobacter dejongeii]|uniref:DUF4350 domain-containing protein n=1 Tax=Prosthecobacter dejongeii TaxID=48465 RepID=A0A7W7YNI8_9BACT|nr:DUF4350 domain-containing protein [Prosthecobacter dejongeii]MBB5039451.1 hypothetical protein [Prosthecobacter dejongeii]